MVEFHYVNLKQGGSPIPQAGGSRLRQLLSHLPWHSLDCRGLGHGR